MIKLFCYSTLRVPRIIEHVLGVEPDFTDGEVRGDVEHFVNDYDDLMPGNAVVPGKIYDLDSEQLRALQRWEHENYRLDKIKTTTGESVLYFKMRPKSRATMRMSHGSQ